MRKLERGRSAEHAFAVTSSQRIASTQLLAEWASGSWRICSGLQFSSLHSCRRVAAGAPAGPPPARPPMLTRSWAALVGGSRLAKAR
jgi:hypothetical protein